MDEIRRALLGDKAAQKAVTERGDLLSCPFCGGEAMKEYDTMIPFEYVVCCGDCGVMTTTSEDEKVAIREWNTRPQLLTAEEMERLEGLE